MIICVRNVILLVLTVLLLSRSQANGSSSPNYSLETLNRPDYTKDEVKDALSILVSVGIDTELLCHRGLEEYDAIIPPCINPLSVNKRILNEEEGEGVVKDTMYYVFNGSMALICVTCAALAAGLTMGLLSLEVLDLKIKEMASSCEEEKMNATKLIPLLKDHHRLLVTLLLLNACANEALPIFLDKLVPSYVAVMLSVTLVLFFGEIIPTAIFAGPRKLAIASSLSFVVRFLLFILAPLAVPIAKLLDIFLHEHDGDGTDTKYNRGEIAALVKIQHEERMNAKLERRRQRQLTESVYSNAVERTNSKLESSVNSVNAHRYSVHFDEVQMVQGALAMQIKTAQEVMTPLKKVYAIPDNLILNEMNMVDIYRHGFSRVPIFAKMENDAEDDSLEEKALFRGVLLTRNLIVVDAKQNRPLNNIPWQKPYCVDPKTTMVDLVNLFQRGTKTKGGHMAVVCSKPKIANEYLDNDKPIPAEAGVLGVVSLEDCVEELIQEEIYDEFDEIEKKATVNVQKAFDKWKTHAKKAKWQRERDETMMNETTSLVDKTNATLV